MNRKTLGFQKSWFQVSRGFNGLPYAEQPEAWKRHFSQIGTPNEIPFRPEAAADIAHPRCVSAVHGSNGVTCPGSCPWKQTTTSAWNNRRHPKIFIENVFVVLSSILCLLLLRPLGWSVWLHKDIHNNYEAWHLWSVYDPPALHSPGGRRFPATRRSGTAESAGRGVLGIGGFKGVKWGEVGQVPRIYTSKNHVKPLKVQSSSHCEGQFYFCGGSGLQAAKMYWPLFRKVVCQTAEFGSGGNSAIMPNWLFFVKWVFLSKERFGEGLSASVFCKALSKCFVKTAKKSHLATYWLYLKENTLVLIVYPYISLHLPIISHLRTRSKRPLEETNPALSSSPARGEVRENCQRLWRRVAGAANELPGQSMGEVLGHPKRGSNLESGCCFCCLQKRSRPTGF